MALALREKIAMAHISARKRATLSFIHCWAAGCLTVWVAPGMRPESGWTWAPSLFHESTRACLSTWAGTCSSSAEYRARAGFSKRFQNLDTVSSSRSEEK